VLHPYGKRTGVTAVDRLNIVAHDRFQEIVDEANKPGSSLHLQTVILNPEELTLKTVTVVSQSRLETKLGIPPEQTTGSSLAVPSESEREFTKPGNRRSRRSPMR